MKIGYSQNVITPSLDKPVYLAGFGNNRRASTITNRAAAAQQYLDQRRYFDLLGAPVNLVIGNHDGESGRYLDGTTNNLAVWSRTMRMKYFPEPLAPDGRNYYAWQTNNALFVVLVRSGIRPAPATTTTTGFAPWGRSNMTG